LKEVDMAMPSASDIFKGQEFIRQNIVDVVKKALVEQGLSAKDYAGKIMPESPASVTDALEDPSRLTEFLALSMMAPLGVSVEDVLPSTRRLKAERDKWRRIMPKNYVLAATGGKVDRDVSVELFIRFKALSELNDSQG
jgi:hypothetical protein